MYGEIPSRSLLRITKKKLAFFFIFVVSSFLKQKQFPIILISPRGEDNTGSSLRNNKFEHDHQMSTRQVGNGPQAETHEPSS